MLLLANFIYDEKKWRKKSDENLYLLSLLSESRIDLAQERKKPSPTHLYVVHVDDGAGDVGQQVDELVLVEAHILGDVVDHELDPLVVAQDVDAHGGHAAVAPRVARQHLQLEVARVVGREQVVGADGTRVIWDTPTGEEGKEGLIRLHYRPATSAVTRALVLQIRLIP